MKQKQHDVLMKAQKRERAGNKLRESNSQAKILLDFKRNKQAKVLPLYSLNINDKFRTVKMN